MFEIFWKTAKHGSGIILYCEGIDDFDTYKFSEAKLNIKSCSAKTYFFNLIRYHQLYVLYLVKGIIIE